MCCPNKLFNICQFKIKKIQYLVHILSLGPQEVQSSITLLEKWIDCDLLNCWYVVWWISKSIQSHLYLKISYQSMRYIQNSCPYLCRVNKLPWSSPQYRIVITSRCYLAMCGKLLELESCQLLNYSSMNTKLPFLVLYVLKSWCYPTQFGKLQKIGLS